LGDAIQFVRYLPLLAARGAHVILECLPALRRLFEHLSGVEDLLTVDDPLPGFDVHTPLLSLPHLFGTTLRTIPADVPYLSSDPSLIAPWRQRLADHPGFKLGLAWEGSHINPHNARRSTSLETLLPLASL